MTDRLIITKFRKKDIALYMKDDEPVDLFILRSGVGTFSQGDMYIGKVTKVAKSIGSAFIDICPGVTCYFHLSELPWAVFTNKLSKKEIGCGDELIVQVTKEAAKNKLPSVSAKLTLRSDHLVLTHGNRQAGVSSKIEKDRQVRIRQILNSRTGSDYGLIARTSASLLSDEALEKQVDSLCALYEKIRETASFRPCFYRLFREKTGLLSGIDSSLLFRTGEITVDDPVVFSRLCDEFADKEEIRKKLTLHNGMPSLPVLYSTDTLITRALSKRVWLKHGGFLIIEPTEALTVIDVNSGKQTSVVKKGNLSLQINKEAALEIGRQLRFRNLSGIIIVDFINMEQDEEDELVRYMKSVLSDDPVGCHVIGMTKLGLMEITRTKTGQPLFELLSLSSLQSKEQAI